MADAIGELMSETSRLTRQTLLESFESYGTPRGTWLVGGEFERTVVRPDGRPVGYFDPDGIRFILEEIAKRDEWAPVYEGDHIIALAKGKATVTLEPGGQVELSGSPHDNLTDLGKEMRQSRQLLLDIAEGRPLRWIAAGLTPFTPIDKIEFVPKSRYVVMREYLPQYGHLAHYMMKGTTAVQASFDYADEKDCAQKVRLASRLAPLTIGLFANSPLLEGKDTGYASYRAHVWRHTDPARTGLPPALRDQYTHEAWLDYLLDVPMMFVHQGDRYVPANGATFRSFVEDGFEGRYPNAHDWELHQTSVFPEVRIKRTIEVRGADCVNHHLAMSFCALFTGLFYCRQAKDEALKLADELFAAGEPHEMLEAAARAGLGAKVGKRTLADWASDLGDIAERGLNNCLPGDLHLLEPLLENIEDGRCPADQFREAFERDPSPANVLSAIAY